MDVTYVTNNELGFDYLKTICLRDGRTHVDHRPSTSPLLMRPTRSCRKRGRFDHLGRGDDDAPQKYDAATLAASYLEKGRSLRVDYKGRRVTLTDNGRDGRIS